MSNTMRDAFEASVLEHCNDFCPQKKVERNACGDYASIQIEAQWLGWQAAVALLEKEISKLWHIIDVASRQVENSGTEIARLTQALEKAALVKNRDQLRTDSVIAGLSN